jgi:hypothetical protein
MSKYFSLHPTELDRLYAESTADVTREDFEEILRQGDQIGYDRGYLDGYLVGSNGGIREHKGNGIRDSSTESRGASKGERATIGEAVPQEGQVS